MPINLGLDGKNKNDFISGYFLEISKLSFRNFNMFYIFNIILHPTNNGSQETIFHNYHGILFYNYMNCIRFGLQKNMKIILQSCDFSLSVYKEIFFNWDSLHARLELNEKEAQKD